MKKLDGLTIIFKQPLDEYDAQKYIDAIRLFVDVAEIRVGVHDRDADKEQMVVEARLRRELAAQLRAIITNQEEIAERRQYGLGPGEMLF